MPYSEDARTNERPARHAQPVNSPWPRRLAIIAGIIIALVIACLVGLKIYTADSYPAGDTAEAIIDGSGTSDDSATAASSAPVSETDSAITFGDDDAEVGIILYPGAKVDPASYAPLAQKLADKGYYCVIVKMPFNLAFLNIDAANSVISDAPDVGAWWIGGHSLGGAMAAEYAAAHNDAVEGVILLAAYSSADLSESDLSVLTIYGSEDGVLNTDSLEAMENNLPDDAKTRIIAGGNHAGFGDYGPQDGDGTATITATEQQSQTANMIQVTISTASTQAAA